MTIEVYPTVPIGVYTVIVRLVDDNELDPATSEYKIVIVISESPPGYG